MCRYFFDDEVCRLGPGAPSNLSPRSAAQHARKLGFTWLLMNGRVFHLSTEEAHPPREDDWYDGIEYHYDIMPRC
jgi:hypothetical protein